MLFGRQWRRWLRRWWNRSCHTPWSSLVVSVEKKDGSKRFCVDYRHLNAVMKKDVFPLPQIDDNPDSLAQSCFFTMLDLASGFGQVKMSPNSQEKTAFATHSGLYDFRVMPFGLCNSPATSRGSRRMFWQGSFPNLV